MSPLLLLCLTVFLGTYRTINAGIKAAIDAASPAVLVSPGTYSETILIETNLEISREGDDEVIVIGSGCHTVSVMAGTVKLKGLTLRSTGTGPWSAVFAGGSAALTLEACSLQAHKGPAFVSSSSSPCSAVSKTSFSSNLSSGAVIVSKASFTANGCTFSGCALSGLEVRSMASATATACEMSNCRQSGVLSCDEGSSVTCSSCTMTNCLVSGVRAEDRGTVTLDKCNVVRNQGSGCFSLDGGVITAKECPINSNAGHGVCVHAAVANLSGLHVDFNARHGIHASQQSSLSLEALVLVNNSQKGLMFSPRTLSAAAQNDVVAKDVWWPSPNCGPKEVYVD
jgi:hypothetical protein